MKNLIKKILREEIVNDVTDIQDELLMMLLDTRKKLRDNLVDYIDLGVEDESVEMDEQISYKGIPEIKRKLL